MAPEAVQPVRRHNRRRFPIAKIRSRIAMEKFIGVIALTLQLILTKPAAPARDIERYDYTITFLHACYLSAYLFYHAHWFMADNKIMRHIRNFPVINMKVRAADRGRRNPDDYIIRFLNMSILNLFNFNVLHPLIGYRLHCPTPFSS